MVGDVLAQRLVEPHRVRPRGAHHHRLGLPGDLVRDVGAEVLDDDLGLLGQVVLVQGDEPGDRLPRLRGLVAGVVLERLLQVPVRLVGGVVGQHVEDEPLLDRLAHRVQVERLVPLGGRVVAAEQLQRLALRGRGEREEAQVLLPPPGRHRLRERLVDLLGRQVASSLRRPSRRLLAGAEDPAQLLGGLAGLGGVRLVHDHRVPAVRERLDLVQHERELLQRGDDDPGLLPGQRVGELAGVLLDPLHDAVGVLELVDRVLQLPVQHHPVGDHDDLVEHLRVARRAGWTAGAPARRSCSTSPTRPSAAPGTTAPGPRPAPRPRGGARRPTGGTGGRSPCAGFFDPLPGFSTCTNRPSRSSQASRSHTCSHRYAVACPVSDWRVARAAVVALVERQEPGVAARPAGSSSPPAAGRPRSAPPPGPASGSSGPGPCGTGSSPARRPDRSAGSSAPPSPPGCRSRTAPGPASCPSPSS